VLEIFLGDDFMIACLDLLDIFTSEAYRLGASSVEFGGSKC